MPAYGEMFTINAEGNRKKLMRKARNFEAGERELLDEMRANGASSARRNSSASESTASECFSQDLLLNSNRLGSINNSNFAQRLVFYYFLFCLFSIFSIPFFLFLPKQKHFSISKVSDANQRSLRWKANDSCDRANVLCARV